MSSAMLEIEYNHKYTKCKPGMHSPTTKVNCVVGEIKFGGVFFI